MSYTILNLKSVAGRLLDKVCREVNLDRTSCLQELMSYVDDSDREIVNVGERAVTSVKKYVFEKFKQLCEELKLNNTECILFLIAKYYIAKLEEKTRQ